MLPTIGRTVLYQLSSGDAEAINRRRADRQAHQRKQPREATGYVAHVGNHAEECQVFPAVVVRVFDVSDPYVNLQVSIDGNDTYWATSRTEGDGPGQWSWPTLVPQGRPRKPSLCDTVRYRGAQGRLAMRAAIVTGTVASLHPDGVASGDVPALDDDTHVHLWVFTPGLSAGFPEFNVPCGEDAVSEVEEIPPGSWCWPQREEN